jgi:hypothetical protein
MARGADTAVSWPSLLQPHHRRSKAGDVAKQAQEDDAFCDQDLDITCLYYTPFSDTICSTPVRRLVITIVCLDPSSPSSITACYAALRQLNAHISQGWELLLADPVAQEEAGAQQAEQAERLLIDFSSQKGRHAPPTGTGRPRNLIPDTALPRALA